MLKIPKKVGDRLVAHLKTYQTIASSHKAKDVSEADTVTLVKDVLAYCFGFDKYEELTSEQQIRGTFCDLAVKIDGKIRYLIEVKAAGVALNDSHLRQALAYGANQGIEWVVLTNSIEWRLYRIKFGQPIDHEEVSTFNLLEVSAKNEADLQRLYLLCREGFSADAMGTFHQHMQVLNRYTVGHVLLSEPIVSAIRREMRRLYPDARIDADQIGDLLVNDVLKREILDSDKGKDVSAKIRKLSQKLARAVEKKAAAASANNPDPAAGAPSES